MNRVSCPGIPPLARVAAACVVVLAAGASARAVPIVALLDLNQLAVVDSAVPGTVVSSGPITGLPDGEQIIAIDFRPATGQLYGLSRSSRLYVINPTTRAAVRLVGVGPLNPALNSHLVGFDFDPARDRLRITADDTPARQNLLVNPDPQSGGTVTAETPPEFAPGDPSVPLRPALFGLAYDNNFGGTTHSRLYAIHRGLDAAPFLVAVAGGQARTVGPLNPAGTGNSAAPEIGFDIAPVSGVAYVALKTNSPTIIKSSLYTVNLVTGASTPRGEFGFTGVVTDIAVLPPQFTLLAVNAKNELLQFNSAHPETILSRATITGMAAGEQMQEIDFNPSGTALYGLGRTADGAVSRVYRIDPGTAVATAVGGPLSPAPAGDAGFDFYTSNGPGLLRLITQTEQNLVVNPTAGNVQLVEPPLAFAAGDANAGNDPNAVASAHAGVFPGAPPPTQYSLHHSRPFEGLVPFLARHAPLAGGADTGQMFTVGSILSAGLPVDLIGFDIAHGTRAPAFATFISMDEGVSKLYTLDLANGGARFINAVDVVTNDFDARRVRDLAVAPSGTFTFRGFTTHSFEAPENCATVLYAVTRNGDRSNEATVEFETVEVGGPFGASERKDFTRTRGRVFFEGGQITAFFEVPISDDSFDETGTSEGQPVRGETMAVALTNPSAGFTFDPPGDGRELTFTLISEGGDTGVGNVIDDTSTFVCQHYHDFLNRNPDEGGFTFWKNGIDTCGNDAACREVKRIDTSAAFFLSIEFQESGFLVYRAYKAAFGRTPVPVRLAEFLPDTHRVGRVIVGHGDWQAHLEANKRAYFDEFVMREAFRAQYPASLTAAQFVDALNQNAGGALSQAERDDLAGRLAAGFINRAEALRAVAEDADLRAAELNRAFVLMQYFGYLRRDPDAPPDSGFGGYNFWLNKLNSFDGDFRAAEMVRAFISSIEYRQRFGQ